MNPEREMMRPFHVFRPEREGLLGDANALLSAWAARPEPGECGMREIVGDKTHDIAIELDGTGHAAHYEDELGDAVGREARQSAIACSAVDRGVFAHSPYSFCLR